MLVFEQLLTILSYDAMYVGFFYHRIFALPVTTLANNNVWV